MNGKPDGSERLFPGLKVPEPPEDLRRHVLTRASQALDSRPRRDLWERIWESRPARLAWGGSVLALVICHFVVPVGDGGPAREPSTLARTGSDDQQELAVIADLPRLSLDARSIAASVRTPGETEADPDIAVPPAVPEENAS
jgi:hypothetical protein